MKNIKINFNANHLFLLIASVVFFYLFIQNFIFSSNFDLLLFREVDDVAFQDTLRGAHQQIMLLHLDQLLRLNDYDMGGFFGFQLQ